MFLALAFSLAFSLQANHLVIPITIDGTPTYALFDTGGGNTIDPQFARKLGLHVQPSGTAVGAGDETVKASRTDVNTLGFGGATMHDQGFAVLPLPGALTHGNGIAVNAIVGREILAHYVTRIDYDAQTLTFTPTSDFHYDGSGVAVPLQLKESEAVVRGSIDGLSGSFMIDTGSSASLILSSPFVNAHNLRETYHTVGNMIVGRGIGGYSRADLTRGKRLCIGTFELDDMVIDLSTDTAGAFASHSINGNLGNDILQRLTMTLDYRHHVVYIEPNARTGIPTPPNRTGMYLQNDDRNYFDVVDVLANGPAFDAGLRTGDRITAIDGVPVRSVTENDFWQLSRDPVGTKHVFTVDRNGQTSTFSVTLRDIV
ncbi:MAG TPA: aspartyl protease family protein [Candidatus Acidoferrales bacterium]|nr:aspartyl protease family protein [Candidatus Acidoferrales bacterium]